MKNERKLVREITSMDEDFSKWYTDVVKKSDLVEYSNVRGCMIIKPYGYKIWENIQSYIDNKLKETGHENVYMPIFIPESLLKKESEHVEGFAPEVAWVTYGGNEKLNERLCIRPTSETLFCEYYSKTISSYRDLPKLYNQWCSVVRWEKSTRPFLRTTEFLWQEGHTAHETEEEAINEALKILDVYQNFCEDILAIPIIKGKKTLNEKFAGAKDTYTIESMTHDGRALQSGTTHNFSDIFSKAFDIKFSDKQGIQKNVFQTSWGISTRLIGAMIMVHGDNKGLCLPPKIAPTKIAIIPINNKDSRIMEKIGYIYDDLKLKFECIIDNSNKSAGWKFNEYDMKGIPIRLEFGPKDFENNSITLYRRDTGDRKSIDLDSNLVHVLSETLDSIHENMFLRSLEKMNSKTYSADNFTSLENIYKNNSGFTKAMLCNNIKCELGIKDTLGIVPRCIPFKQERISDTCIYCNSPTDTMVILGRSY